MYARIIRTHVPPENFDQALAVARDYNLPMVAQMPGFRSGYWTADRQTGTIATCVVFDSQDGIRAADAGMERMRPLAAPLGVQFDSVENLEVFAAQEGPIGAMNDDDDAVRKNHRPGTDAEPAS